MYTAVSRSWKNTRARRGGRRPRQDPDKLLHRFRDPLPAAAPPVGNAADEGPSGGPQQQAVSNYMHLLHKAHVPNWAAGLFCNSLWAHCS